MCMHVFLHVKYRNLKLKISSTSNKAKSPYSQALNQNKIERQGVMIQVVRQADRQTVRRLWWMVYAVDTGEEGKEN